MAPPTLTFMARKGGVGRTTLTLNLAGCFAQADNRVLCLDLDGQASLSRAFLGSSEVERLRPHQTIAALFAGDTGDAIHETPYDNIAIAPAGDALETFAVTQRHHFAADQHIIADFLDTLHTRFDVVLIDTPPLINLSTVWAALAASHYVLSPVPPDAFGVQSISSVLSLVADVQAQVNPRLLVLGYVISMAQRNSVNDAYRQTLRQLHGSQVFETEIPLAAAFKEAAAVRGPLPYLKPRVKATKLLYELAGEIERRLEALAQRNAA